MITQQHFDYLITGLDHYETRKAMIILVNEGFSECLRTTSGVKITSGPRPAENEQDHLNLTEDGRADHHVQTIYFVGSIWKDHLNIGRTI